MDENSTVAELHERASELCNQGRHAEAVSLWLKALETEPRNLAVRRQLAQAYSQLADRNAAIEAYRGILKFSPGDPGALLAIAVHLSHLQRHEEALKTLAELLESDPQNITALLTKGQIEAHLGLGEDAAATFRGVLEIDPGNDLAWISYANVAPMSGDSSRAIKVYRRLVRAHPGDLAHWRALGQALVNQEQAKDAAASTLTHASGAIKGRGTASRLPRYRPPVKETNSTAKRLLGSAPKVEGRFRGNVARDLRIDNERLGKLVAQQHSRLGLLDSHLTSLCYGYTSYYLRTMALFMEKFGRQGRYPSAVQEIPASLIAGFSMNGRVPIEYGYINNCYPDTYVDMVTDDDIERFVALLPPPGRTRDGLIAKFERAPEHPRVPPYDAMAMRAYSPHDNPAVEQLFAAFREYPIRNQEVAVFGARGAFYESMCIWAGAHPTAVRALPFVSRSSRIRFRTLTDWESKREAYDCALAVNVAQEGLGAFGEELDPDADIKAIRRLKEMVKPGGTAFLVIPLGSDRVHFNLSRIYGRERLPRLLEGWKVVSPKGAGSAAFDGDGKTRRVLVLQNI